MRHKERLSSFLLFLTITLMLLPLLLTFNDVITKFMERFTLYPFLEQFVVPFQARVLQVLLQYSGFHATAYQDGILVQGKQLQIGWNCLGWQSLLLFLSSLLIGLRDRSYTLVSIMQVILLGLFGIFWVNIVRMMIIVILTVLAPPLYQFVYHDILAAVVTILYLLVFWWFAYRYVLEEK